MKPEWITDNLLELAKRLHELGYRKEIREGDWYIWGKDVILRVTNIGKFPEQAHPIPTLTQCLDWLRKWAIGYNLELPDLMADDYFDHGVAEYKWICQWGPSGVEDWTKADTPTEAAYLAMLKILEVEAEQQRKDDEWEAIRPDPQEEGDK